MPENADYGTTTPILQTHIDEAISIVGDVTQLDLNLEYRIMDPDRKSEPVLGPVDIISFSDNTKGVDAVTFEIENVYQKEHPELNHGFDDLEDTTDEDVFAIDAIFDFDENKDKPYNENKYGNGPYTESANSQVEYGQPTEEPANVQYMFDFEMTPYEGPQTEEPPNLELVIAYSAPLLPTITKKKTSHLRIVRDYTPPFKQKKVA